MQVYRIKLQDGHTAEANQVSKDGYLCDENGQPYLYSRERARIKANKFGGKPEKFGKKYTTSVVKTIQFDEIVFEPKTLQLLQDAAVYKHDSGRQQFFVYASIFEDLLGLSNTEDIQEELQALAYICQHYDYIQILTHI